MQFVRGSAFAEQLVEDALEYVNNPHRVWTPALDVADVKVSKSWLVDGPNAQHVVLRAESEAQAPPVLVADFIFNCHYSIFGENCESYRVVEDFDASNHIVYYAYKTPHVANSARDLVFFRTFSALPDGVSYVIASRSVTHPKVPVRQGFSRSEMFLTAYVLRPVPDDPLKTKIISIFHVDLQLQQMPADFHQSVFRQEFILMRLVCKVRQLVEESPGDKQTEYLRRVKVQMLQNVANEFAASNAHGWRHVVKVANSQVYFKKNTDKNVLSTTGILRIAAPPADVFNFILDDSFNRSPTDPSNIFYEGKESVDENTRVVHGMWKSDILQGRLVDMVVLQFNRLSPDGFGMSVCRSVAHLKIPPTPGVERIELLPTGYLLHPIRAENGTAVIGTLVSYCLQLDMTGYKDVPEEHMLKMFAARSVHMLNMFHKNLGRLSANRARRLAAPSTGPNDPAAGPDRPATKKRRVQTAPEAASTSASSDTVTPRAPDATPSLSSDLPQLRSSENDALSSPPRGVTTLDSEPDDSSEASYDSCCSASVGAGVCSSNCPCGCCGPRSARSSPDAPRTAAFVGDESGRRPAAQEACPCPNCGARAGARSDLSVADPSDSKEVAASPAAAAALESGVASADDGSSSAITNSESADSDDCGTAVWEDRPFDLDEQTLPSLESILPAHILGSASAAYVEKSITFLVTGPSKNRRPPGAAMEAEVVACGSTYLELLPRELLLAVFEYCDERDLCRLAQASRRFNSVAGDDLAWKQLYYRRWFQNQTHPGFNPRLPIPRLKNGPIPLPGLSRTSTPTPPLSMPSPTPPTASPTLLWSALDPGRLPSAPASTSTPSSPGPAYSAPDAAPVTPLGPDEEVTAVNFGRVIRVDYDWRHTFRVRRVLAGSWLRPPPTPRSLLGHQQTVRGVALSGDLAVSCSKDRNALVHNIVSGECVRTLVAGFPVLSVAMDAAARRVVVGCRGGVVRAFDLESSEVVWERTLAGCVADGFVFLGQQLVTWNNQGIDLWNAADGVKLSPLTDSPRKILSVAPFAGGQRLVSGASDKAVDVWDVETARRVQTLNGHSSGVNAVDGDEFCVVSGGGDRTARLWDVRSGDCVAIYNDHLMPVRALRFDPDRVVTGADDAYIRVFDRRKYDLTTRAGMQRVEGHRSPVMCLRFDDKRLVSAGRDLLVWDFGSN